MTDRYYTGVGRRKTPADVCRKMTALARLLAEVDYILRSGGADGADLAFEQGCDDEGGEKEIYLPWRGFNNSDSPLYNILPMAFKVARSIHPKWDSLSQGSQKLHARNVHQVTGKELNHKSRFLLCWTEGGKDVGGTRTAIVLARKLNVPVFNLGDPKYADLTVDQWWMTLAVRGLV